MSDEPKPQAGQPENDKPTTPEPAPEPKGDWRDAEIEKARKEAAKRRVDNKTLSNENSNLKAQLDAVAPKLEKLDALEQSVAKLTAALEAAEASRKKSELETARTSAAVKYGLPPELAKRIQGETPEAMDEDAKALAAAIPQPTGKRLSPGNSGQGVNGISEKDQMLQQMRGRKTGPSEASYPSVHKAKGGGVVGVDTD